jgi:hypothetical protein
MMGHYYTLVASLPQLPPSFDAVRLPISAASLQQRLDLLAPQDRLTVERLTTFFVWDRQPLGRTDDDVWETYRNLQREIVNPLAKRVIDYRVDMRTIVAGLRMKRYDEGYPRGDRPVIDWIRHHWNEPFFGLARSYPWIEPFSTAVFAGEVLAAQQVLFHDLWKVWSRWAEDYHFRFENIVLYLARWEIVERWTSRNAEEGRHRFDDLLAETLGNYAKLF